VAGADGHLGENQAALDVRTEHRSDPHGYANLLGEIPNLTVLNEVYSCRTGLTRAQQQVIVFVGAGLGLFGLFLPNLFAYIVGGLLWGVFSLLIFWRFFLLMMGISVRLLRRNRMPAIPNAFPVYSILVAVYHEQEIADQLACALRQLVWPAGLLDIQILLEADDEGTISAMQAAHFPDGTRFTIVPPGGVRTKSNALNYGLARAKGEYTCIYDAEDRPHPGQLLEAHRAFLAKPLEVACMQAPLVGDNEGEALIAAHWSLEYAIQFGLLLPAMAALRLPIPIGGTSNHFRIEALREVGGWDAWNVTEDADLGLRLARFGRRVATLNLPTYEDAPAEFSIWTAQRSRWIKGFMQTWMVLMRHPGRLYKELGFTGFFAVQLALGGAVLAPIFHAPLLALVIIASLSSAFSIGLLGTALLGTGVLVGLLGDILAPAPLHFSRVAAILTRPFYWPLHSISAARALWELAVAPHFWAKTPHKPHRT